MTNQRRRFVGGPCCNAIADRFVLPSCSFVSVVVKSSFRLQLQSCCNAAITASICSTVLSGPGLSLSVPPDADAPIR